MQKKPLALASLLLIAFAVFTAGEQAQATHTSTLAPSPPSSRTAQSPVQQVLNLVNAERKKVGAPPLAMNAALTRAAEKHAKDMNENNEFSHTSLDGRTSTMRMKAEGYPKTSNTPCRTSCRYYYGENIAKGQKTATQVMQDWMNSSGHRRNIVSPNYKEIGVALVGRYWVQDFGGVHEK